MRGKNTTFVSDKCNYLSFGFWGVRVAILLHPSFYYDEAKKQVKIGVKVGNLVIIGNPLATSKNKQPSKSTT